LLDRIRLWDDLKEVVAELNTLMPVLTADTRETIQATGGVAYMVKPEGADIYIIVANYERREANVELSVPGVDNAEAEILFQEGTAHVTGGTMAVELAPIESRVYRIKGK